MEKVTWADVSKINKTMVIHNPLAQRWQNANPLANKFLIKNDKEKFCFYPFSYTPRGMVPENTFGDSNKEIKLSPRTECSSPVLLLAMVAPTPLPPNSNKGRV